MKRTAIITGICGQDGSYLAELLLGKGYRVFGLKRRTSSNNLGCATHLEHEVKIVEGDLADPPSLQRLCRLARAEEFYNLAAQSHVGTSFEQPIYTLIATGQGVLNCLEAIRQSGIHSRFYQASTSELFGGGHGEVLLSEGTMYHPRSPYACAKLYGYWITVNYRESYKMYACNGISFNHESPRRGPGFVTRKITMATGQPKAKKGQIPILVYNPHPFQIRMTLECEYSLEKMASAAATQGLVKYPYGPIHEALRDLMMSEFHDILPGSSIENVEVNLIFKLRGYI